MDASTRSEPSFHPRPSPLRLWGFLVTIVGGTLMGVGSILAWASVSIVVQGAASNFDPIDTRGLDILEGRIALGAAILVLIGIPAMRGALTRTGRRAWAITIVLASLLAGGVVVYAMANPEERLAGGATESCAQEVSAQVGVPLGGARSQCEKLGGADVELSAGLYVAMAGAVLGIAGGILGVIWAGTAPLPPPRERDPGGDDVGQGDPG
jgi:hypothetical protein